MDSIPFWCVGGRKRRTPRLESCLSQLRRAGLEIERMAEPPSAGYCVALLDEEACRTGVPIGFDLPAPGARLLGVLVGSAPPPEAEWALLTRGLSDCLLWSEPRTVAKQIVVRLERWREVDQLLASPLVRRHLVGDSPPWIRVLRQVIELACFTDSPALVTGQTGTGKELVARLIHTLDRRPDKKELILVDCTTVVPELSGSEFFGHERGAFTGAVAPREGAFALADRGTLFLDEVGELSPPLQAGLLRAVEERAYRRVGGNEWRTTEFRLICATHRDLREPPALRPFRRDLYYRIAAWQIHLPSLVERRADIPALVDHFLRGVFDEPPPLDPAVRDLLLAREYPGNVRDLRQLVLQIAKRHVGPGPITVGEVPEEERPATDEPSPPWTDDGFRQALHRAVQLRVTLKEIGQRATETAVDLAMREEQGNVGRAAARLGVTPRTLQHRRAARRARP